MINVDSVDCRSFLLLLLMLCWNVKSSQADATFQLWEEKLFCHFWARIRCCRHHWVQVTRKNGCNFNNKNERKVLHSSNEKSESSHCVENDPGVSGGVDCCRKRERHRRWWRWKSQQRGREEENLFFMLMTSKTKFATEWKKSLSLFSVDFWR